MTVSTSNRNISCGFFFLNTLNIVIYRLIQHCVEKHNVYKSGLQVCLYPICHSYCPQLRPLDCALDWCPCISLCVCVHGCACECVCPYIEFVCILISHSCAQECGEKLFSPGGGEERGGGVLHLPLFYLAGYFPRFWLHVIPTHTHTFQCKHVSTTSTALRATLNATIGHRRYEKRFKGL